MRYVMCFILLLATAGIAGADGPDVASPFDASGADQLMEEGGLLAEDGLWLGRMAGNDWYVSPSGDDGTGDGSSGNPWQTIQHAVNKAGAGDSIHAAAGTYNERVTIGKSLTLLGAQAGVDPTPPGARTTPANESIVTEAGLGDPNPDVLIEITNGTTDVVIDGFTLVGDPTLAQADTCVVRCGGSAGTCDGIDIRYNIVDGKVGVLHKNGADLVVYRNRMVINKNGLVVQFSATNPSISENVFSLGASPAGDESAMYVTGTTGAVVRYNTATGFVNAKGIAGSDLTNVTVHGNTFTGNKDGVSFWGSTTFVTICNNDLSNSVRYGVAIKGQDVEITGNTIAGAGSNGVYVARHVIDTERVTIAYNYIAGSTNYGVEVDAAVTDTVDAEYNWWGDRTGPYDSVANPGGLGDAVTGAIDYDPWLLYPQIHPAFGGARLEETQAADGGWGWPLGSPPNTIGPIGMGLCKAYRATLDSAMYAALEDAAVFLTSKTVFSPPDGYLAYELDTILGDTDNRDYVKAKFYDELAAGTYERESVLYDTEGYVQYIRDRRTGDYANLAAWDIGMGIVGAHACGADTYEWIKGTKAEIDELDGSDYYDVIGLAGALYGLAYVGEEFDPANGEHAAASNLAELANILAGYQLDTGGFTWNCGYMGESEYNETVQETSYSILALNAVGGHKDDILSAVSWLEGFQLTTGGWKNWEGGDENNEVTAEALWGLSAANLLALNPDDDALYIKPGEYAQLYMDVSNLQQLVTGCQAMLNFSSTYFDWTDVLVQIGDGTVWNELIWAWCWGDTGDLDVAVGVDIDGGPTDADGTVAKVRLTAKAAVQGITRVVFRPDVHPDPYLVESTFFSDEDSQPVWPNKWDSHTIVIDNTAPCVEDLAAIQDQPYADDVNVLDGANPAVQGEDASGTAVEITVTASDLYLVGPPLLWSTGGGDLKLTHEDNSTTLDVVYVGKVGLNDYKWTVDIGATAKNGRYNFSITAEDMAGWQTTVSGYIVVNKNQITGGVAMDTWSTDAYDFDRDVIFKATDSGGNVLKTWTESVHFVNNPGTKIALGSYTLTDVPGATENLSAKTAWSLRERVTGLDMVLDYGQETADFTGGDILRGGDLNGSNSINILDYSILRANWYTHNAVADINADDEVNILDYSIMKLYWFQHGEAE